MTIIVFKATFCSAVNIGFLWDSQVEDFVKVIREVDEALADDLEDSFPKGEGTDSRPKLELPLSNE